MNQTVHSLLEYVVLLRDFSLAERIMLVDITLDFLDQVFCANFWAARIR